MRTNGPLAAGEYRSEIAIAYAVTQVMQVMRVMRVMQAIQAIQVIHVTRSQKLIDSRRKQPPVVLAHSARVVSLCRIPSATVKIWGGNSKANARIMQRRKARMFRFRPNTIHHTPYTIQCGVYATVVSLPRL